MSEETGQENEERHLKLIVGGSKFEVRNSTRQIPLISYAAFRFHQLLNRFQNIIK